MTNLLKPANKLILTALLCTAVVAPFAWAQDQPGRAENPPPQLPSQTREQSTWQTFDLDFPGGSPHDLVSAIERATGKPLNVLVPKDGESVEIPAMKFKAITVPDLFRALLMATQRQQQLNVYDTYYTFETKGEGENAIFYFTYKKPTPPQKFCRFYQLTQALQSYSIEDITTAIQTGWKMLGVKSTPELKFHPETKLLIAVGQPEHLSIIDDVLRGLRDAATAPAGSPKKDAAPAK
jgi:hypothetical protein